MPDTGIIILAHGTRGERGSVELPDVLRRVAGGIKPFLPPGTRVTGASLQFNHPGLEEAAGELIAGGIKRLIVMPYFLFSGRHITEDIPEIIESLKNRYPRVRFILTDTLGKDELFISQVVSRIEGAAADLWPDTPVSPIPRDSIESLSMEIIENLLPPLPGISGDEKQVVKRIVHASGDPHIATLIRFNPGAIDSGVGALVEGRPILTDVRMAAAGINKSLAEACGCRIACAMDEADGQNQTDDTTRTAAAMRHPGKKLDGAIIAIGNAPTALLALLDMIDAGEIRPSLVVGMPVGFVQARESKGELMKRDIKYITVAGTRGGSAMAAAAVNALLKIAVEKKGLSSR